MLTVLGKKLGSAPFPVVKAQNLVAAVAKLQILSVLLGIKVT
jgi:hypothetical protein